MKFVKYGTYWGLPIHRKLWWNFKYWFKGVWMFLKVVSNYQESVVENELALDLAWHLCHSLQEAKMGKCYRIEEICELSDTEEE